MVNLADLDVLTKLRIVHSSLQCFWFRWIGIRDTCGHSLAEFQDCTAKLVRLQCSFDAARFAYPGRVPPTWASEASGRSARQAPSDDVFTLLMNPISLYMEIRSAPLPSGACRLHDSVDNLQHRLARLANDVEKCTILTAV